MLVAVDQLAMQQHPDAVALAPVAVATYQLVVDCLAVAVVDTSYAAVVPAYADAVAVVVADVLGAVVPACGDAVRAFDGAFVCQRVAVFPHHRGHYLGDQPPPPPGACNSHRQLALMDDHLALVYDPYGPYPSQVMLICIHPCRRGSRGPAAADNTLHFVCPFCRRVEI